MLPYIDAKSLRDVRVEVKDRLKFDVPIFGEPAPEVSWFKGEELIEDSKSISLVNLEGHTKIVFNSITKENEGSYSLVIRNRSGEDSAKFSVTVIGLPEAPEGPLQTSIEGNMVTLLWKRIKDDGGAPLEHYQVLRLCSHFIVRLLFMTFLSLRRLTSVTIFSEALPRTRWTG